MSTLICVGLNVPPRCRGGPAASYQLAQALGCHDHHIDTALICLVPSSARGVTPPYCCPCRRCCFSSRARLRRRAALCRARSSPVVELFGCATMRLSFPLR